MYIKDLKSIKNLNQVWHLLFHVYIIYRFYKCIEIIHFLYDLPYKISSILKTQFKFLFIKIGLLFCFLKFNRTINKKMSLKDKCVEFLENFNIKWYYAVFLTPFITFLSFWFKTIKIVNLVLYNFILGRT